MDWRGRRVIELGSGTGVVGILAALLGMGCDDTMCGMFGSLHDVVFIIFYFKHLVLSVCLKSRWSLVYDVLTLRTLRGTRRHAHLPPGLL